MIVEIRQIKGISFIAKGETNHWVCIDGPTVFGGSEAGSRPKELLLIALGSCSGSDIASILHKKKIKLQSFTITVKADISDQIPKVFTKIHIDYEFYGDKLNKKDIERAIDLSQNKYCPISAMLQKACPIDHSYKINKSKK